MQPKVMDRLPILSFHTVLYCRKWTECVAFYRDILGFPVVFENELFVELETAQGARIGLLDAARSTRRGEGPAGFLLSFRVEDIQRTHEILSARLPDVPGPARHPWGALLFEFQDPDGRRIEFWSPAE